MILKTCSRSRVPKKPWRSKAYKAHVASFPCLACGSPSGPPHHIRETMLRTMGRQKGDEWMVPLCAEHHADLHARSRFWWFGLGINPVAWCEATHAKWSKP